MPRIHHVDLGRELEVSDQAAEILTTVPRKPWRKGPLPKRSKPPSPTPSARRETPDQSPEEG